MSFVPELHDEENVRSAMETDLGYGDARGQVHFGDSNMDTSYGLGHREVSQDVARLVREMQPSISAHYAPRRASMLHVHGFATLRLHNGTNTDNKCKGHGTLGGAIT